MDEGNHSEDDAQINSDFDDAQINSDFDDSDVRCNKGDEEEGLDDNSFNISDDDDVLAIVHSVAHADIDVEIEPCKSDLDEQKVIADFVSKGCGCNLRNGQSCSLRLSDDHIANIRLQCAALSHDELDMVVLGQLMAMSNKSDSVVTESRHSIKARKHTYTSFSHGGIRICRRTFQFLHGIGKKRLFNLISHFKQFGLTPRIHGNTKRLPCHSLSLSSVEFVVRFLLNYSEQNAILLPGRIPGYQRSDIKLLPSSVSKRKIWRFYQDSAEASQEVHVVAYSTFNKLWRSLLPGIMLMKPRSDLCWTCQQNSTAIMRSANKPDSEKSATILAAQEHLTLVRLERSFYKTSCETCRSEVHNHFCNSDGSFSPPLPHCNIPPNSVNISCHYSFDYAQQVHYPADPLQPGPIFFLTPRKCNIFGVHCEAIPRQVNFLIDEAVYCGKGSNSVISQLHFFFEHHGLGERNCFLHCDNCTGQNKNRFMMQYLAWRCMTGLHTNITVSFLVVGHTKFAPDWGFGLVKRLYRRTKVSTLTDIAEVVDSSAECNVSQLASTEDGTIIVPTYNWSDYFAEHFKSIPGIKKYHHFHFSMSNPGIVLMKENSESPSKQVNLLKDEWSPSTEELPPIISPNGLSNERQWYLYDSIRPFCPENAKDRTCPMPAVARHNSRANTPINSPPPSPVTGLSPCSPETVVPASKRQRICGLCKNPGHNRRSCPEK